MSILSDLAAKLRGIFGAGMRTGFEQFEFDTAGPADDEHPLVPLSTVLASDTGDMVMGWWSHARRAQMNAGRIGPPITPRGVVVHTTDMVAGTVPGLVKRWGESSGDGAGATYIIGRDALTGTIQLCANTRNSNHAGGKPSHGWFKTSAGALIHPNTCTIGIEIDNAGLLKLGRGGQWVHADSGRTFSNDQVFVDKRGRGWERWTSYQSDTLRALLDAIRPTLTPFAPGTTVVPNGTYKANGVPDAEMPGVSWLVGHWTLDPTRKTDPGSQITDWMRDYLVAHPTP